MFWVIWSKGCQRCGGDFSLERDRYGTYLICLQCGATKYMRPQSPSSDTATLPQEMSNMAAAPSNEREQVA